MSYNSFDYDVVMAQLWIKQVGGGLLSDSKNEQTGNFLGFEINNP